LVTDARDRLTKPKSSGYAIDPVGGMQVEVAYVLARAVSGTTVFHFHFDHCKMRFEADPARFSPGRRGRRS
jgi:YHS domain-containing protein